MVSEHPTTASASGAKEAGRGRSTIEFPYSDQDAAVEIANAAYRIAAGSPCEWDQVAGVMKQAAKSGGFRLRVMAARSFGLIEYDRSGITLTDLGFKIRDSKHARAARIESFLRVPLFREVFEKLKGQVLPPPPAIERIMEQLGVAPKQKDKARQVFIRSAKQAGYFEIDPERLLSPPTQGQPGIPERHDDTDRTFSQNRMIGKGGGGGGDGTNLDPLIEGLVKRLPNPGTDWPITERRKWLQAAANNFELIYTSTSEQGSLLISVALSDKKEAL